MPRIEFDKDSEYFAKKALSQSQIKALLSGMGSYKTVDPDEEEAEHFILGNAVDCLLLTPSLFLKKFYKTELVKKPSTKVMSILRHTYSIKQESDLNDCRKAIQMACNAKEYYMKRSKSDSDEDGRVDLIIKDGTNYWKELIKSKGRTMLDDDEWGTISTIVESIKSHSHTSSYFEERKGVFQLTQLPIYFKYKDVDCKALLDLLIVDTINKTIQIIDIKTMGESTKLFRRSAKKRRYDIQAAWYTLAVKSLKSIAIDTINCIDISEYKILPFKFIVDSTASPGFCPLVFTCSEIDLAVGRHGADTKSLVFKLLNKIHVPESSIRGFEEGIELYKWHHEHNNYEYDKYILESQGELPLEIWGK